MTARTEPPAGLGPILAAHRHKLGLSYRQAAARTGLDAGYLCRLEHGTRCPSAYAAELLVEGLAITGPDAEAVLGAGIPQVGRDRNHPVAKPWLSMADPSEIPAWQARR